jgi:hypothetical protein
MLLNGCITMDDAPKIKIKWCNVIICEFLRIWLPKGFNAPNSPKLGNI